MIINDAKNKLPDGLLTVWTNNPKIITSSIYNNSVAVLDFLNRKVIRKVNKIFLSNIERFFSSVKSIKDFFPSRMVKIEKSFSNYFFKTPKADINAIYKKGQGTTKEELRILPNFKKIKYLSEVENQLALENIFEADSSGCNILRRTQSLPTLYMPFYAIDNVDQIFEIGSEADKLPPPISPTITEKLINILRVKKFTSDQILAREQQELQLFTKDLQTITLEALPKSTISIEEIIQKNEEKTKMINHRLKKANGNLTPLTPLTNKQANSLERESELNDCTVDWLEKPFVKLSNLLQLDSVELSNMIEKTHELLKNRKLKSQSKSIINNFQKNLKKLQDLVMQKQVIQMNVENLNQLTTSYKNYIKLHKDFLKKSFNHKDKNIEHYVVKISSELTKCLADIDYNLC